MTTVPRNPDPETAETSAERAYNVLKANRYRNQFLPQTPSKPSRQVLRRRNLNLEKQMALEKRLEAITRHMSHNKRTNTE